MATGSIHMQIDSIKKELKGLKVENKQLLRILLNEMIEAYEDIRDWSEDPYSKGFAENTLKYVNRLETLVELLEIYDCGNVGRFGKGQPDELNLEERMDWLIKKYGSKA